MEFNKWLGILGVFVFGMLVGMLFSSLNQNISGFAVLDSKNLNSIDSPQDYLNESSLLLYKDKLTIKIKNASIASYKDTESMAPFITNYSNGIIVVPQSESEIAIGDVVSFTRKNLTVVHRVVSSGVDGNGTYFITQGDNSNSRDEMIRFNAIENKLVGILY